MNKKSRKKKTKLKKDNILIIVLALLLIILIISIIMMAKNVLKKDGDVKETQIIDKIDGYGYQLTENNTKYFKKLFKELKKELTKDEVDEEKYATLVAQMFTADFYDLDSKLSKTDVGGVQFIPEYYRTTFIKTATASNGMYYSIESNLSNKRNQELPVVENVDLVSLKNTSYKYGNINDSNAYQIDVKITYKEDLNYPKTVSLKLIHVKNVLQIVEVN